MEKSDKGCILLKQEMDLEFLDTIIEKFEISGKILKIENYGSGHINTTYRITTTEDEYILQKVNTSVFKNMEQLIENVAGVTAYLASAIEVSGGNPKRETLQVIHTRAGENYLKGEDGFGYRMYYFITDASCYDTVEKPEHFYESAVAFGRFQALLAAYPAETLYETIPDFHHTAKRFDTFCRVVEQDPMGRVASAQEEIAFVMEHAADMPVLTDMLESGELPLRVTHNDTKLNNIMIDNQTGKGICILDLDTVMPGLSVNDFGDSIRFGANTALEDETDLSKVALDLELYEIYVKGFLEGCQGILTENEVKMLPMGAKMMTLECGMRFLTDYLEGDTYFKIHRKGHNLDRARCQFALVTDMERKWSEMERIVQKYSLVKRI